MNARRLSVVIPAHNEESVIGRTLRTLLREAHAGEFEIIVVCNGCNDETAACVRDRFPSVTVLEREEASKTAAINAGIEVASGDAVLLLDADIELTTDAARALFRAARRPGVDAAIGHMAADTEGAHWMVRAFYRVWMEHPYLRNGKFAAAIALSAAGLSRVGALPDVTADDAYLRNMIPAERVAVVDTVVFLVRAPRTVSSLVRIRSRSYRGNRELEAVEPGQGPDFSGEARGLARRIVARPALWPAACIYLAITLAARRLSRRDTSERWERDLTTRLPRASQGR
jgi:glycosyltransferase involved in cell wall biosynthesis